MDTVTASRLINLHPVLVQRYTDFDGKMGALGIPMRVTAGFRTWSQQDILYAGGRTAPGKIVTEARGGFSAHNFGYAVDIVPGLEGFPAFQPDWTDQDERWTQTLATALECGLAEGAMWRTFPDRPHLYLRECPATPTDDIREAYRQGGIVAAWQILDELIAV